MKASDLELKELIEFGDGRIDLQGRRLVLHSINAFAQLRRDLLEMVGLERMRRILTRFGYFWGQADAAAMKRVFEWDNVMEWLKAGPRLHTIQGVARSVVKSIRLDESSGRFRMEVIWHDSGEAEEQLLELGKTDYPICRMLAGYASGYCSFCVGRDVYFIEEKCRAKGDRVCSAIGMDRDSWGEELKTVLPYFQSEDIQRTIRNLTRELRRKTREVAQQRKRLDLLERQVNPSFVEVHSASFRRVLDLAGRIAPFDTSVLITGESGVGKEVLARYIHSLSTRSKQVFVGVNCGALPETLLESELFGHKAGAFTGATRDRVGLFEQAQKGTVFLDEIGDVSPAMQLKLLRVLQEKEIMRVGESIPRKIDIRVISATNRDLSEAIREGRFREDLYYRLGVIEIEVPPLRERKEDILSLVRHFVQKFSRKFQLPELRLDATCLDILQAYSWPGNVRELENAIERAAVLSRDGVILPECLPPAIQRSGFSGIPSGRATSTLAEVENNYIRAVLKQTGGNRTKAADILGISPATLWRKLKH
ncbi:MAG TPA: sigma-54-dependent Fis family transcriptional regulator [bacterium]|nr:sigma-54-dependent Fis family transcriptional regulator [bacterium]HQL61509.1 sigma-54-dependent Fis family transcriptional regulator [bacterium]